MCVVVIQEHFSLSGDTLAQRFIIFLGPLAVPCFMFLSFYFAANTVNSFNVEKIKNRIAKLYIPIIVWNIVYFVIEDIWAVVLRDKGMVVGYKSLLKSFLFSHVPALADHLWFLFAQIVILVIMAFLFLYAGDDRMKLVITGATIAFVMLIEYTGIAYYMFSTAPYETAAPLGRVIECIPYAACGLAYALFLRDKELYKRIGILIAIAIFAVLAYLFVPTVQGYGYNGLFLMFGSAFICMCCFELKDVFSGKAKYVINYLGSLTMGVYFIHRLLGKGILLFFPCESIEGTLVFIFIVFILSLIVSFIVRCLLNKTKWKFASYII